MILEKLCTYAMRPSTICLRARNIIIVCMDFAASYIILTWCISGPVDLFSSGQWIYFLRVSEFISSGQWIYLQWTHFIWLPTDLIFGGFPFYDNIIPTRCFSGSMDLSTWLLLASSYIILPDALPGEWIHLISGFIFFGLVDLSSVDSYMWLSLFSSYTNITQCTSGRMDSSYKVITGYILYGY